MAGLGVWLGGFLAGIGQYEVELILASIAAALVSGAGNAINDFADIESDKINHPNRPLARGDLPSYSAILIGIVFNIFALILAAFVNVEVLILVIIAQIVLVIYNFGLKRTPVIGNIIVSLLGALTLITGGLAAGMENVFQTPGPIIPAAFAFLIHLGRELIKDFADMEGDRIANYKTLPAILPVPVVLLFVTILFLILIFLTFIPRYYGWYNPAYIYLAVFAVDLPLTVLIFWLWISQNPGRFKIAGSLIKLFMLFGLAAFFFGKI